MEAHFRNDETHSYRNYKYPWTGRPNVPPDARSFAIDDEDGNHIKTVVYVRRFLADPQVNWRRPTQI